MRPGRQTVRSRAVGLEQTHGPGGACECSTTVPSNWLGSSRVYGRSSSGPGTEASLLRATDRTSPSAASGVGGTAENTVSPSAGSPRSRTPRSVEHGPARSPRGGASSLRAGRRAGLPGRRAGGRRRAEGLGPVEASSTRSGRAALRYAAHVRRSLVRRGPERPGTGRRSRARAGLRRARAPARLDEPRPGELADVGRGGRASVGGAARMSWRDAGSACCGVFRAVCGPVTAGAHQC